MITTIAIPFTENEEFIHAKKKKGNRPELILQIIPEFELSFNQIKHLSQDPICAVKIFGVYN